MWQTHRFYGIPTVHPKLKTCYLQERLCVCFCCFIFVWVFFGGWNVLGKSPDSQPEHLCATPGTPAAGSIHCGANGATCAQGSPAATRPPPAEAGMEPWGFEVFFSIRFEESGFEAFPKVALLSNYGHWAAWSLWKGERINQIGARFCWGYFLHICQSSQLLGGTYGGYIWRWNREYETRF